jgi:hypothetical protein
MAVGLDKGCIRAGRLGLLVALCLGLTLAAWGQGADPSPVHYFNERTFQIPFAPVPASAVKVLLHASSDGQHYSQVATALPSEGHFIYNAPADGWYFFIVQVQDLDGRLTPPNVSAVPTPGLRVCVDTERPRINLRPIQPDKGTVAVEWQISDRNLDLRSLRLAYRAVGVTSWTALKVNQLGYARFDWTPPAAGDYEIQLGVADRAGNRAIATTRVTARAGMPGEPGAGGAGTPRIIHVNKKTFRLNYKLDNKGPSGVKRVEVWMTRDTRQWTRYKADAPPDGPYELTVATVGRYGFTLRPISGVGRGHRPPDIGEPPQLWIVVDEKSPIVRIHDIKLGEGKDTGTFTVSYSANDEHLRPKPIRILWATDPKGEWTEILRDQENTGSCRCRIEAVRPHEFYLRVEATDQAGNKGHDDTRETVKTDITEPIVKELTVEGVAGGEKP